MSGIGPIITSVPTTLTHGNTYKVTGKRFNGTTQNNMYGDDVQMATNYPLVRITNTSTGHALYCRRGGRCPSAPHRLVVRLYGRQSEEVLRRVLGRNRFERRRLFVEVEAIEEIVRTFIGRIQGAQPKNLLGEL